MGILFKRGGMYTTIQDMGRYGYQSLGFSTSGVMDKKAYTLANMLLDNDLGEAVIEFTMVGPSIQIQTDTFVAITGGSFSPRLNGDIVQENTAIQVHKGDCLEFGQAVKGSFGYIAFAGGIDIPKEMNSYSTNTKSLIGGFHGRKLKNGDYIRLKESVTYLTDFLSRKISDKYLDYYNNNMVRVIPGPQDNCFTKKGIDTFYSSDYVLTAQCDRMGYRLEGSYIEHKNGSADIISDGICEGAVQVPAHGQPIIMLADRQTTGGYTKIATVISSDIPVLVQKRQNDVIKFKAIGIQEAQEIYMAQLKEYEDIKKQIHKPCREVLQPRAAAQRIRTLF